MSTARGKRSIRALLSSDGWYRGVGDCLCLSALFALKYGAGFSWRQVLVAYLAYGIWKAGAALLKRAEQGPKFQRVKIRIGLGKLEQAFVDAGIYSEDELEQNKGALWESLGPYHSGWITFTWLQRNLYFTEETGDFWNVPEVFISLKPFGARAQANRILSDLIVLRGCHLPLMGGKDEYELVLIKAEDREYGRHPEGSTLVLMKLPYEFFRILQQPINDRWWTTTTPNDYADLWDRQREVLEGAGLKYWHDEEAPSDAWEYRGKYASLKWWTF